jgi:hypothetical protein
MSGGKDERHNEKRQVGRYHHYRGGNSQQNDFTQSRSSGMQWFIGYTPNVGDKLRRMPHVNPAGIVPYDHEWQAKAHADKLNEEIPSGDK